MNASDPFEAELQRLQPAKPPEEFMARLSEVLADLPRTAKPIAIGAVRRPIWPSLLFRWLAPAMALAAVLAGLNWRAVDPAGKNQSQVPTRVVGSTLKADRVEIERRLVGAFDAIARMPGGEPVRFRCREWADDVVFHDSSRGITIEKRTPRLEVIPVSLETY